MVVEFGVYPAKVTKEANGVDFFARVDGKKVHCLISEEALQFLGDDLELLECFEAHWQEIEKVARRMIDAGYLNSDGDLLIIEADLQ